jgi:predicted dehydrogenase
MSHTLVPRRQFLRRAAAASTVFALPTIIPASALGLDGKPAPSGRITFGCIGTGGKGRNNLGRFLAFPDVQVLAVCDADAANAASARGDVHKKYGNTDCQSTDDFRELCARKDLDAVSIATPDHWHALTSIVALDSGKHVYCEKPLANSIREGRAMVEAVQRNNRVLQCGSHERSNPSVRFACEQIRNGKIGKLHTIRVNLPTDQPHHAKVMAAKDLPPMAEVPEGLDYDAWLGFTPYRSYRPFMADEPQRRCHFWWRFNLTYGGGEMTDRGAHVIDLAGLAADTDHTGPVEIEARGERASGMFDAFFNFEFTNKYAGGLTLVGWASGPRGIRFEGDDGWIFIHIHGGKLEASRPELTDEASAKDNKILLGRTPSHHRNFVDAILTGSQPFATAEIGHRTATICHLNNIAMKLQRTLKWDPQSEQVIGDDEANRLCAPAMREWLLPNELSRFL